MLQQYNMKSVVRLLWKNKKEAKMSALDELVAVEKCNCYYVVREKVISGVIKCAKCNNDGLHHRPLTKVERKEFMGEATRVWFAMIRKHRLPSGIEVRRKK